MYSSQVLMSSILNSRSYSLRMHS